MIEPNKGSPPIEATIVGGTKLQELLKKAGDSTIGTITEIGTHVIKDGLELATQPSTIAVVGMSAKIIVATNSPSASPIAGKIIENSEHRAIQSQNPQNKEKAHKIIDESTTNVADESKKKFHQLIDSSFS